MLKRYLKVQMLAHESASAGSCCKRWLIPANAGSSLQMLAHPCKCWLIPANAGSSLQMLAHPCKRWLIPANAGSPLQMLAHVSGNAGSTSTKSPW